LLQNPNTARARRLVLRDIEHGAPDGMDGGGGTEAGRDGLTIWMR
jgi:hypothetical protein